MMMEHKRPGLALAAALAACAAVAGCGTGDAEEAATSLQTVAVERGSLRITAEATGTVEPTRKVEVKSKAGGEILEMHVDVGDVVEPGTLLASIDPRDVRNRFDQAEADLEVAEARAEIARNQLARQEQLRGSGVITEQELESARLEYANAQANLIKARTNLELAELQLGDVTIRAPMKGTIIERPVEEGQVIQSASGNVSGGTTLMIMANLDRMQVRTLVDETDMGEIRAGMPAQVEVEAYPDRDFAGTVEKIEPQAVVQQNVTMFPVIVSLDNNAGLLRPGMNAEVEILIDEASDVLLVPNGAVVEPQDAGPAAMALGIGIDQLDLAALRGAGRFAGAGGQRRPAADAGSAGRPSGAADRPRGGSTEGAPARGRDRRAAPGGSGPPDAADQGSRQVRNAVVFVVDPAGVPRPKLIQIGLSDWDHAQVVSGLEEGDQLAVVGAAQLQAQQQEFLNRVRSRGAGGPFGR